MGSYEERNIEIYLPSNSTFLESNTAAEYTVELPKPIVCVGEGWEVAVKEAHYPLSWHNVPSSGCQIQAVVLGTVHDASIMAGYYQTPAFLLTVIHQKLAHVVEKAIGDGYRSRSSVEFHAQSGRCTFHIEKNVVIVLNPHLSRMLGFGDGVNKVKPGSTTSHHPIDITGGIDGLYIQSDMVAPYPFGNRQSPLLRMVPIPGNSVYGAPQYINYEQPAYVRIAKHEFSTISIAFKDGFERPIPFAYGKTTVLLHLRRRTRRYTI